VSPFSPTSHRAVPHQWPSIQLEPGTWWRQTQRRAQAQGDAARSGFGARRAGLMHVSRMRPLQGATAEGAEQEANTSFYFDMEEQKAPPYLMKPSILIHNDSSGWD
jgi:hypothetical protein